MSVKMQIFLIAIALIITVINQFNTIKRIEQLEENQEILRIAINQINKRLNTNDYTNTNPHNTKEK